MDNLDYKQVAKNILRMLDDAVDRNVIAIYVEWVTQKRMWHTHNNYKMLCEAFDILGLPEPTEEEWKKR